METLLLQWHELCQDFYQVLSMNLHIDGLLCFITNRDSKANRYAPVYVNNDSVQKYVEYAHQYDPVHYSHLPQTVPAIAFLNQYEMNATYQSFLNHFNYRDSAEIITPYQQYQFGISLVRDNSHPHFQNADREYLEAIQKLSLHFISKMALPTQENPTPSSLTKKEHAVLKMLCMGLSNQEMADQTFCSITTIKTHVSHILYKTDCKSRQQLISKYHAQTLKSVPMP